MFSPEENIISYSFSEKGSSYPYTENAGNGTVVGAQTPPKEWNLHFIFNNKLKAWDLQTGWSPQGFVNLLLDNNVKTIFMERFFCVYF